jgi:hypothetical protein
MPAPHRTPSPALVEQIALEQTIRRQTERRRQIRGLLLLFTALLIFILLRAGLHNVFTPKWWRVW